MVSGRPTCLSLRDALTSSRYRSSYDSGGRAFYPYLIDDLASSFAAIGDELRNQYSLAYAPAGRGPDGKFHKIKVGTSLKDMHIRARNGYWSAQPAAAPAVTFSAPPR